MKNILYTIILSFFIASSVFADSIIDIVIVGAGIGASLALFASICYMIEKFFKKFKNIDIIDNKEDLEKKRIEKEKVDKKRKKMACLLSIVVLIIWFIYLSNCTTCGS